MPPRSENPSEFALYSLGGKCAWCGATENLQTDHIDWRTKIPGALESNDSAVREAELAKCQALCFPCHLKKSKQDLKEITTIQMSLLSDEEKRQQTAAARAVVHILGEDGKIHSPPFTELHKARIAATVKRVIAESKVPKTRGGLPTTKNPNDSDFPHGRASSYRYCHCQFCRDAHAKRLRDWYARKLGSDGVNGSAPV